MRKVYVNVETGAITIVNADKSYYDNMPDMTLLGVGNKRGVLSIIEDYWDENFVELEKRIFETIN